MTDRQVIVVDVEATGLRPNDAILEVAAVNLETGEELHFVPCVSRDVLASASFEALQVNRYFERGVWRQMRSKDATWDAFWDLRKLLEGNVLAGSNPSFDAKLIAKAECVDPREYRGWGDPKRTQPIGEVWHYRLLDLSAYTAGVLGLPLNEAPGMHKVCELVGVANEDEHSALGDARATAECFRRLREFGRGAAA